MTTLPQRILLATDLSALCDRALAAEGIAAKSRVDTLVVRGA